MDTPDAAALAALVAAYCHRPAVRHALGLDALARLRAAPLARSARSWHYLVESDSGRRWVARLSVGSYLGLSSAKQTAYTALAQRLVEPLRVAPEVCFVDATLYDLPFGLIIMQHLAGRPLDYTSAADRAAAARVLARVHALPLPADHQLQSLPAPLTFALRDGAAILAAYTASAAASAATVRRLHSSLRAIEAALPAQDRFAPALIHTDPHAHNWVITPPRPALALLGVPILSAPQPSTFLLDWETPRVSDPAYDLAHFLAAAQWRAAAPLSPADRAAFLAAYGAGPDLIARVAIFEQCFALRYELQALTAEP